MIVPCGHRVLRLHIHASGHNYNNENINYVLQKG